MGFSPPSSRNALNCAYVGGTERNQERKRHAREPPGFPPQDVPRLLRCLVRYVRRERSGAFVGRLGENSPFSNLCYSTAQQPRFGNNHPQSRNLDLSALGPRNCMKGKSLPRRDIDVGCRVALLL